ncbi:MAG: N-acetylglucosamine-6-phosphate deacetylase [Clostridia bacterium]|nr:N-acetylglucosamine-6-phosphate deacetylase [Clostridia bacterium]
MLITGANIYRNDSRTFLRGSLRIGNGRILEVGEYLTPGEEEEVRDLGGAFVFPGLVDAHTHGRAGFDFGSCSPDAYGVMALDYARHGVTTVMPTLASSTLAQMVSATDSINRFVPRSGEATFCGVHWEGRFLNPEKKGAHAPELLAPLLASDLEQEVFRMCGSLHISAAYELDSDGSFMRKARELGATLGLGHTNATYEEAKLAEARGLSSYTHVFNCMPPLHHRNGGAVCAALEGNCIAELICDGIHVSPEMVRLVYRAKGSGGVSLISDSMEATGCPDGAYSIAGNPVSVEKGIARTPEGALAGSTLTLCEAVNRLVEYADISLADAIVCATETPAKQVGIFESCGSLDAGKRADLIVSSNRDRLVIHRVMVRGEWMK